MRKLLLLLLLLPFISFGRNYYISTTGNNSNTGTITSPFATWDRISGLLQPSDTCFIRGGTYFTTKGANASIHCLWQNLNGNSSSYIVIMAYRDEVPIFNCSNIGTPTEPNPTALYIQNCSYLHVKGLQVTGLKQIQDGNGISRGWDSDNAPNCIYERVVVSRIGGGAFHLYNGCNDVTYLNCDAHHNDDRYSGGSAGPWGGSDGFSVTGGVTSTRTTYNGCRMFFNSDDGTDNFNTQGIRTYINCWAFMNGYYQDSAGTIINAGDGNGFKLGPLSNAGCGTDVQTKLRFLNNCLAFTNRFNGFDQNGQPTMLYQLYNCTSYKNGTSALGGWGFQFQYSCSTPNNLAQTLKNNISYLNNQGDFKFTGPTTNVSNNSWMAGYSVSAADFLSLDSSGVTGPRQSDGSLPYLPFLRLKSGSDLINTGVNVGLPFCPPAPSLGAFDFCTTLTAVCSNNVTIQLPTTTANISVTASGGQTPYSYSWRQIPTTTTTITNTTAPSTSVNNITSAGVTSYEITVTDATTNTAKDTVTITQTAASNLPPLCSSGLSPVSITLPQTQVALNGSGSSQVGNTVAFAWGFTLGSGTIANANQAVTTATITSAGSYVISLLVVDNGNGLTCTSNKSITVNPQPIVPTAMGGSDQVLTLPVSSTSLSGSGSGGTITGYLWTIIQGFGGVLSAATSATTNISGLSAGTYKVQFRVQNNFGNFGYDTVVITVLPAIVLPTATCNPNISITLPINSCNLIGVGTGTATPLTYQWTKLTGSATFTLLTPTQTSTQFQNLVASTYTIEYKVTDNLGNIARDTVQVIVNPALIIPTANGGGDKNITLPTSTVSLSGSGSGGTINSYRWTKLSGLGGVFSASTSANTNFSSLSAGTYSVELRVGNTDGNFGFDTIQVVVNPAIVLPTATCNPNITIALPTNFCTLIAIGTGTATPLSYQWTKLTGASTFNLVTPTATNTQFTNLIASTYTVEYKVTDNLGNVAKDTMQIVVETAPVISAPIVTCIPNFNASLPITTFSIQSSIVIPSGTLSSFAWTALDGGIITTPTQLTSTVSGITVAGTYRFVATATSSIPLVGKDTLTVTVSEVTPGIGFRYFNAALNTSGKSKMNWGYVDAKNNTTFSVQKLWLFGLYQNIATVSAKVSTVDYTFIDNNTVRGNNTYRIRYGNDYTKPVTVKKK